jgi:hypothetical protein
MNSTFDASDLAQLRDVEEIEIETAASDAGPAHRAVIWVVVDDRDRVLIRSYRGPGARWYREVTAAPDCRIHARGHVIEARAVPAGDPDRVAACSEGLRRKYAADPAMPRMLRDHLETTLELLPR